MKRNLALFANLIALSMILISSACLPTTAQEMPSDNVLTIGFTTSMTGEYFDESTSQTNGYKLWINQINEAGGIRMSNGVMVTLDYKTYDDQSDPRQAAAMYEKLILEDRVDVLFGPYSSSLTETTAPLANQYGKIYISAGAASDNSFKRYYQTVYQIYTPASLYLTPTLSLLSTVDPESKRLALLYEGETFASSAALSIWTQLQAQGFSAVYQESYKTGTTDFNTYVQNIKAAQPDAILAGGGRIEDGMLIVRELDRQNVDVKFNVLLLSPCEDSFADLGNKAMGIICPSQWEFEMSRNPITVAESGESWFGPTSPEFIQAYQQAYGEEPTYYAAGGYAAGLTLQNAIETTHSINQRLMVVALDKTDMTTFFGRLKFDNYQISHGRQIGHEMVYVQWQRNTDGELVKRVVWPVNMATAPLLYPIP
jgi:branched-chain amino acid transport system substrate-binding protein